MPAACQGDGGAPARCVLVSLSPNRCTLGAKLASCQGSIREGSWVMCREHSMVGAPPQHAPWFLRLSRSGGQRWRAREAAEMGEHKINPAQGRPKSDPAWSEDPRDGGSQPGPKTTSCLSPGSRGRNPPRALPAGGGQPCVGQTLADQEQDSLVWGWGRRPKHSTGEQLGNTYLLKA